MNYAVLLDVCSGKRRHLAAVFNVRLRGRSASPPLISSAANRISVAPLGSDTRPSVCVTIVPALTGPESDPISYLAAVVRGDLQPSGLSSLEVNMTVTEILDAARESAKSGKRVDLPTRSR